MRSVGRVAADRSGQGGTMLIPEVCRACEGEGWISPLPPRTADGSSDTGPGEPAAP